MRIDALRETRIEELAESLADSVLKIVLEFSNEPPTEEAPTEAPLTRLAPEHRQKVLRAIRSRKPIRFVLPAFPAKSPNLEKTLGDQADFAELLALKRLDAACRRIQSLYSHGAEVMICSDGRVFSEIVSVSDEKISRYALEIEKMIEKYRLTNLTTFHLDHALPDRNHERMRQALLEGYAQSPDEIREKIKKDEAAQRMFNGMHRFLFEDRLVLEASEAAESGSPQKSREKIRNESKEAAYELIRRSDAWSQLIEEVFPEAVRLSIHPQKLESKKIGVRLLPSDDRWRTPWHSVALFHEGSFSLIRRKDAESMGAQLFHFDDNYPFFAFSELSEEVFHAFH